MKLFECQHCAQVLYFENVRCEKCGHRLGYIAEANVLSALEHPAPGEETRSDEARSDRAQRDEVRGDKARSDNAQGAETWRALGKRGQSYRFCANAAHDACNWLICAASTELYCVACRHNRTVPDLTQSVNIVAWRKLEYAKRKNSSTLCSGCACR